MRSGLVGLRLREANGVFLVQTKRGKDAALEPCCATNARPPACEGGWASFAEQHDGRIKGLSK